MKPVNRICLILIMLLPATAWARGEQLPDADLLEFLGSYETSSDKAIDPLQFARQTSTQPKQEQPAAKTGNRKQQVGARKKPQKDQDHEQ